MLISNNQKCIDEEAIRHDTNATVFQAEVFAVGRDVYHEVIV